MRTFRRLLVVLGFVSSLLLTWLMVLADEPSANLDTATGISLLDTMQALNEQRGTTFVFSTHDPKVVERASRLVRVRDGRVEGEERRR